ncbi:MAG TPA: phage/plasmid primase, P4 family [Pyrinomonadaceae bacterium]|jgi:putative DNA primase/helicase|nr:phage/plasmid primase, P4 family [Pyrinomonadaceae bacterium]
MSTSALQTEINLSEIQAEAEHLARSDAARAPVSHTDVWQEILDALEPIDFREMAELDAKERLSQKHYIVITVQEVLRVARSLNCGLCRNYDFLYSYNGAFWKLIDKDPLTDFLGEAARRLSIDRITSTYHLFREQLYKQFLAIAHLPKPETADGVCLINLRNGTFEITPTELVIRDFRREDFLTYQLPFDYDQNAEAPLWQRFLNEVLPDETRQRVLAEYLGYVFTRLKLEKTLMLYGRGANGKSVVFDVINALLGGENVANYSLASLSHEYHRAKLANKLLNYSSEISTRLEADIFKRLTSGEPVDARLPYGQPFIMTRYARLLFNCNELPRDVEHTEAFFRRYLILPFDVTIPEDQQDKRLAEKIIKSELSGVFNWILGGLQRLLRQEKFTLCEAAREALQQYRKESDSVAMFLADEGYEPSGDFTEVKIIYQSYKFYCLDNGYKPLGRNNFTKRLEAHKVITQRRDVGLVAYVKPIPRVTL